MRQNNRPTVIYNTHGSDSGIEWKITTHRPKRSELKRNTAMITAVTIWLLLLSPKSKKKIYFIWFDCRRVNKYYRQWNEITFTLLAERTRRSKNEKEEEHQFLCFSFRSCGFGAFLQTPNSLYFYIIFIMYSSILLAQLNYVNMIIECQCSCCYFGCFVFGVHSFCLEICFKHPRQSSPHYYTKFCLNSSFIL